MDSSDWSNGIRYHTIDTRPDTEFEVNFHIDIVIFHIDTVMLSSTSMSILSSCHLVDMMTGSYLVTLPVHLPTLIS